MNLQVCFHLSIWYTNYYYTMNVPPVPILIGMCVILQMWQ